MASVGVLIMLPCMLRQQITSPHQECFCSDLHLSRLIPHQQHISIASGAKAMASSVEELPSAAVISSTQRSLLSVLAEAPDLTPFQVHGNAIIEMHAVVIALARSPAPSPKPAADSPSPGDGPSSLLGPLAAACSTGLKHLHELLHFLPEDPSDWRQRLRAAAYAAYTPLPAAVGSDMSSAELALVADVSRPLQCLCDCLAAEVNRKCRESWSDEQLELPNLLKPSGFAEQLGKACLLCAAALKQQQQQQPQQPPSSPPSTPTLSQAVSGLAALACSVAELWVSLAASWPRNGLLLGEPVVNQLLVSLSPVRPPPYSMALTVVQAATLAMALLRSDGSSSSITNDHVPLSQALSLTAAVTLPVGPSAAATPTAATAIPATEISSSSSSSSLRSGYLHQHAFAAAMRIAALIARAASADVAEFVRSTAEAEAVVASEVMAEIMAEEVLPRMPAGSKPLPTPAAHDLVTLARPMRVEKVGVFSRILVQRAVTELLLVNLAYRAAQVHTALQGVSPISIPARYYPPASGGSSSSSSPLTVPSHHCQMAKVLLLTAQAATFAAAAPAAGVCVGADAAATAAVQPAAVATPAATAPAPAPGASVSGDAAAGSASLMHILPAAATAAQAVANIMELLPPPVKEESTNLNFSPELCTSLLLVVLELAALLPESSFAETCLEVGCRAKDMLLSVTARDHATLEARCTALAAAAEAVAPALLQLLGPAVLLSGSLQEEQWAVALRQAVEASRAAKPQHGPRSYEHIWQHSLCMVGELMAVLMVYHTAGPASPLALAAGDVLLHSFKQQPILWCEVLEAAIRAAATSSATAGSGLISLLDQLDDIMNSLDSSSSSSSRHTRSATSSYELACLAQGIVAAAVRGDGDGRPWSSFYEEAVGAGLIAAPTVADLRHSLLTTCLKVYDSSSSSSPGGSVPSLQRSGAMVLMPLGIGLWLYSLAGAAIGVSGDTPFYQVDIKVIPFDILHPLLFVSARALVVAAKHLEVILSSGNSSDDASKAVSCALEASSQLILSPHVWQQLCQWQLGALGDLTLGASLMGEQHAPLRTSLSRALDGFKVEPDIRNNVHADLPHQLAAFGEAMCAQLPVAACCNNPHCSSLEGHSELALVRSGSCRCSGCKAAHYHCRECQRAQWKLHKKICTLLGQAASRQQ